MTMRQITHASLFSGIGGAEIAADWAGWQNLFHCEINPFCRRVLEYHYPNSKSYDNITETDFTPWRGKVTVLTGGFPCQPFSLAGRRKGADDDRKCFAQFGRYSPLGSLARTLMESEAWYSLARRLKWQAEECYSERITLYEQERGLPLRRSAEVLSVRDISSRRLLFRLVPSVRPTGATGCGLLPTPLTQGLKKCSKSGKTEFFPLELLPTPNAAEGTKYTRKLNPNSQMGRSLTALAVNGLLLTPNASDGLRSGMRIKTLVKAKENGNLAQQIAHRIGGEDSQLNPLFVEEMMGFPRGWTASPFQGGEWKA